MAMKKIVRHVTRKPTHGVSGSDLELAKRIARDERVSLQEASEWVRKHRIKSIRECPDY